MNKKSINLLKDYFEKRNDLLMAFVFGSYARGQDIAESDFDIGVYLVEPEERLEDEVMFDVANIVEKEVNLVCMNNAPASLVSEIIKTGIPLVVKDEGLYWDFYLRASQEAEDFYEFAREYFKIYKGTESLTPEQKTRLLERFQFLASELEELREFETLTFDNYQNDKVKRRNIERWAENIINATIDISKIILALEKKRMPRTYQEALYNFGILAGLTDEEAKEVSRYANLRNILAHEYLDILYGRIQRFIKESPPLYKKISDFLDNYLKL